MDAKGKKKEETQHNGYASGSSRGDSNEKESQDNSDNKDKILKEREQRKQEENEKLTKALQQIRFENYVARQKAQEKEAAMFRPSSGMKHSFNQAPNGSVVQDPSKPCVIPVDQAPKKIEEQYGMEEEVNDEEEEELEDIQEEIEENDSENEEVKGDVDLIKTINQQMKEIQSKLIEKTQRIEKEMANIIEQSSDSTCPIPEEANNIKAEEQKAESKQDEAAFDSEDDNESQEECENIEPVDSGVEEKRKLDERIKLLRQ